MNKALFRSLYLLSVIALSGMAQTKDANMGTFTDTRDNKTYKTVKIGNQVWMAENLAFNVHSKGCGFYKNDSTNFAKYGYLYTYTGTYTACPKGWHLPSDAEWELLINTIGGEENAGKKLKTTAGWKDGNGSDSCGFSALPGGWCPEGIYFESIGEIGNWWSYASEIEGNEDDLFNAVELGYYWRISGVGDDILEFKASNPADCCSIRCVKDQAKN